MFVDAESMETMNVPGAKPLPLTDAPRPIPARLDSVIVVLPIEPVKIGFKLLVTRLPSMMDPAMLPLPEVDPWRVNVLDPALAVRMVFVKASVPVPDWSKVGVTIVDWEEPSSRAWLMLSPDPV